MGRVVLWLPLAVLATLLLLGLLQPEPYHELRLERVEGKILASGPPGYEFIVVRAEELGPTWIPIENGGSVILDLQVRGGAEGLRASDAGRIPADGHAEFAAKEPGGLFQALAWPAGPFGRGVVVSNLVGREVSPRAIALTLLGAVALTAALLLARAASFSRRAPAVAVAVCTLVALVGRARSLPNFSYALSSEDEKIARALHASGVDCLRRLRELGEEGARGLILVGSTDEFRRAQLLRLLAPRGEAEFVAALPPSAPDIRFVLVLKPSSAPPGFHAVAGEGYTQLFERDGR